MSYENILYETDGRLAFVTLNRPEKLNALSNDLRGELYHALKEAEADRSIAWSSCGRTAGLSVPAMTLPDPPRRTVALCASSFTNARRRYHSPAHYDWSATCFWQLDHLGAFQARVAQVHGYCLAGGTELASFCDFRIVAEDAQVGYPPVRAMERWTSCGHRGTCR